jgi:2'-hydroxyisoflavone reductase
MKLLVLGGTRFLGRAIVDAALARGHAVTLFHRGKTRPGLFPGVERLIGDRDGGLGALRGRDWDAVVDTSGFVPRVVVEGVRVLAERIAHYTFVSSISVYADPMPALANESAPLASLADETDETVSGEHYGALKALCERAVDTALPGRALVVRPGLIVGPHDYTDRFAYWPRRIARGGEVLAPGVPAAPVQFVDVRDLAAWMTTMSERRASGTFNATGPATPLAFGPFLDACRAALGGDARFTWVDERFLLDRGVQPWSEMPLWVPEASAAHARTDCARALAAGLEFRSIDATVRDTLAWDRAEPAATRLAPSIPMPASMSAERERELLAAWRVARAAG